MPHTLADHSRLTEALNQTLNVYDRRTAQRADRLRELSSLLGDRLGVEGDEHEALRWAALLHDLRRTRGEWGDTQAEQPAHADIPGVHQTLAEHPQLTDGLNQALGVYDERTAQHAGRVRTLALSLGDRLGIDGDEREALGWAALLHDLGKISVRRAILRKAGPLTDLEWIEMKRHPIVGADVLLAISPLLQPIAAGIRGHHERWDGTGYPDGLVGEQIPRVARIIAVADAFDAMTRARPYRKRPYGPDEAADTILSAAGSQFDPFVVAAFAALRPVAVGRDTEDGEGHRGGDDAGQTEEPPMPPRIAA